jgi:hypothetical protein
MKWIWCVIWILGALLVIASLDKLPDPPAANPSGAAFKASLTHECAPGTPSRFCEPARIFFRSTSQLTASDFSPVHLLHGRMVLMEQAADPSPPESTQALNS